VTTIDGNPRRYWLRLARENIGAARRLREIAKGCTGESRKTYLGWAMDAIIDADEYRDNARQRKMEF
jgi:hypothetical protein